MDKEKNYKLIAEFMGEDVGHGNMVLRGDTWTLMNYRNSWDELMPVIEKISDNDHHTLSGTIEMLAEYYYKGFDNEDGLVDIEEFYQVVVQYLEDLKQ